MPLVMATQGCPRKTAIPGELPPPGPLRASGVPHHRPGWDADPEGGFLVY